MWSLTGPAFRPMNGIAPTRIEASRELLAASERSGKWFGIDDARAWSDKRRLRPGRGPWRWRVQPHGPHAAVQDG